MKRKWKWILGLGLLALAGGGTYAAIRIKNNGIVTVQTGRALRQDLTSLVTASGEIKPLKYINIGANVMGRITEIHVREGDRVRRRADPWPPRTGRPP